VSAPVYIGGALVVADDSVPRDRPVGIAWPEALVGDCTIDANGAIVEIPPRHAKTSGFSTALAKGLGPVVRIERPSAPPRRWGENVRIQLPERALAYVRCVVRREVARRLARAIWAEMGRLGL
jgi:hypothetical protein